jgi:glycyl-tRNA synthetase
MKEVASEPVRLITEEMLLEEEKNPVETTIGEAFDTGKIEAEWLAYFMGVSQKFISYLGVPEKRQRFRAHLPAERAHYSTQTFDHEVQLESWGWIEIAGHAYRTDFDLKAHMKGSGLDMAVLKTDGSKVIPHVVEPSFGLDRLFYMVLENSYVKKEKRNILQFKRDLAPYQVSVFPLVTKDGLPVKASEVEKTLLDAGFIVSYDESGSIGRRYARSDEIGVPLAVTIDYDTLDKGTITVRDRDSWSQVILKLDGFVNKLGKYFSYELEFSELGKAF